MNPKIIKGNVHSDTRGTVRFVNDFDMTDVVRMYCIKPELNIIRAWQGHKIESKWFFVAKGRFLVKTVAIDGQNSSAEFILSAAESQVLFIPGGHFNGFQALEEGSVLMVFSDFDLEASKADDIRENIESLAWIR